ncbi:DUF5707 domain-containing protein [Streptomyces sp. NPDC058001]|uniref:DUF5707 domain-containing protein n=1 Tax=Streptomyces sp. NPDC058001 TaxID=3346300 RepID=UPI0036E037E7
MRIRASVAVVTGALALTALTVPAAQADGPGAVTKRVTPFAAQGPADDSYGDTKVSNVVVNGGKNVVLGTATKKTFTVSFTATDNTGIAFGDIILWHGPDLDHLDNVVFSNEDESTCTKVNATTSTCKSTFTVDVKTDYFYNSEAGSWKTSVFAQANDGDYIDKDNAKTWRLQRASKLTVNASPEPVKKGKTLTVTGALTRANWESLKYAGYTQQSVQLQFRKKGSSTYSTIKTIKSDTKGNLKTTVKASTSGYWRYVFAGTSTTPAVKATGDYVAVN